MAGFNELPPEFYMALGGGIMSAPSLGQGIGQGFQNASGVLATQREKAEAEKKMGLTYQALQQMDPEKAELFKAGVLTGPQAYSAFEEAKAKREAASRPSYKWINEGGKLIRYDENSPTANPEVMGDFSQPKLPAIAEEYNWAKENGFNGTPQEYQAWKANLSKQKGMTVEYDPETGFRMTQGEVDGKPSKITEGQSKDINWLTRGTSANEELSTLDAKLAELGNNTASKLGTPGNYLKDADYQLAERAGRDFLAVVLRKDSGGAITPAEMEEYGPMFLPVPGDKPPAIAAKKKAREVFLKAMHAGLPDQMQKLVPDANAVKDQADPAVATPSGKTEVIVNGKKATIERVEE